MNPRLLTLAVLPLVLACESETLYKANKNSLEAGLAALQGDPRAALAQAESIVTRTSEEPGPYTLQRFFGAYLAAQAHLVAAEQGAFLPDTVNAEQGAIRLGNAAAGRAGHELAIAHLVAAMYHAGLGVDWLPRAQKARTVEDGAALLPERFEQLGATQAGTNLVLSQIAIFARLRFQGRVDRILRQGGLEPLQDFEACKTIVESSQLQPWLRMWLAYAIHDFLRQDNPVAAFKFAVAAIALEAEAKSAFPRKLVEQLEQFVLDNPAGYEWFCPGCGNACSQPSLPRCIHCNKTKTVDFSARRKEK